MTSRKGYNHIKPKEYNEKPPRAKARPRGRATRLLMAAGLREPRWHGRYAVIISTVSAVRPAEPPG